MVPLTTMWLVLLALYLTSSVCSGHRVSFDNDPLPAYDWGSYRQQIFHRVGIFAKDSPQAGLSGTTGTWPSVSLDLTITDPPHGVFQVFIYEAEFVEKVILPSLAALPSTVERGATPFHPCMDVGQSTGAALLANMSDYAYAVDATSLVMSQATDSEGHPRVMFIREEVLVKKTGLYIIWLNGCRFREGTGNASSGRLLDVSKWYKARVSGTISVRNPYGYLLGQLFGLLPWSLVCVVASATVLAVYGRLCWRSGRACLFRYQWSLLALCVWSLVAYAMFAAYYLVLNSREQQSYGLYVAASVALLVRGAASRCVLYVLGSGWGVTALRLPHAKRAVATALTVSYFLLSVANFALVEYAFPADGQREAEDVPGAALVATGATVAALEGLFAVLIWLALRDTLAQCATERSSAKRDLFRRCVAALVAYAFVGLVWELWTSFATSGVASSAEESWRSWWCRSALWELLYLFVLAAMAFVFRPTRTSLYFAYGEQLPTGEGVDDSTEGRGDCAALGANGRASRDDGPEEASRVDYTDGVDVASAARDEGSLGGTEMVIISTPKPESVAV